MYSLGMCVCVKITSFACLPTFLLEYNMYLVHNFDQESVTVMYVMPKFVSTLSEVATGD